MQDAQHYLETLKAAERLVASGGFALDHVEIIRLLAEHEPLSKTEEIFPSPVLRDLTAYNQRIIAGAAATLEIVLPDGTLPLCYNVLHQSE